MKIRYRASLHVGAAQSRCSLEEELRENFALPFSYRVEQLYQKVMSLWHQLHVNMKSLVSWNYLRKDITLVQSWNLEKVTMQISGKLVAGIFSNEGRMSSGKLWVKYSLVSGQDWNRT